jgi:adenylate cyclase class IV
VELKRTDLIGQAHGNEKIMQELFGDNQKVRKLRDEFTTQVVKKELDDSKTLDDAYGNFVKISKGIQPEQLLSTNEYTKLREAYKLFGTLLRFAPHSQIPNEPPCAGVDYKP